MCSQWTDSDEEVLDYKALSAQEAKKLLEKQPVVSWWRIIVAQLIAGMMVVLISMFWYKHEGVVFCAVAGVMVAWIPSAIITGWMHFCGDRKEISPGIFLVKLYFVELVKVVLTIVLLVMAFLWVKPLVWPSLLAGFVVTVKAYGLACWLLLGKHKE